MFFGLYSFPRRLLTPLPQYDPYAQPSLSPCYGMSLPVPPPPNAVQYPRITLRAADWSPRRQCFIGECKLVAKIEGSSFPDYECRALFTVSYVPVNEWFTSPEFSCGGPVLIYSRDLRVIWDATQDSPVVEATTTIENNWKTSGVEAYGPCELLVLPVEGSNFDSYACAAFYTLQCEPLEDWKVVHAVAENGSDFHVGRSEFHEQETSAAACEDLHRSGRQNDVKSIPAYETPKTESQYFQHFPLSTEVVPQPDSDEQKESSPVEISSGEPSMRSATQEYPTSSAYFVKYYSDKKLSKNVEGRVHNGIVSEPITELSLGNSKTCTLLQNEAMKQYISDVNRSTELSLGNSIPLKTFSYSLYKESETTDSTLYKNDRLSQAQVKVKDGLRSGAPDVNAQTVTTTTQSHQDMPKLLEKQEIIRILRSIISKSQERKEKGKSKTIVPDMHQLMAGDKVRVAAENKRQDTETETETVSTRKEKDKDSQVSENKGSSFLMPLDEESSGEDESSEWDSDEEEEEDYEDGNDDTETDSTENGKDNEFQATGSQGSSAQMPWDDEGECSEWESGEEEDDDSSQWETVEHPFLASF